MHHDILNRTTFPMYIEDNLWCHYFADVSTSTRRPIVQQLSLPAQWELWYHRYGHCNDTTLENVHKYTRGIPKLNKPHFYVCSSCARNIKIEISAPRRSAIKKDLQAKEHVHPGQNLHMNFGFVRVTSYQRKNEHDKLITSIDGFRSYLIVADRPSIFKWLSLATTKNPTNQQSRNYIS